MLRFLRGAAVRVVVIVLMSADSSAAQDAYGFVVDYETIVEKVKVVAMTRLQVEPGVEDLDRARAAFEPVIRASLRSAGFHVLDIEDTDGLWMELSERSGGFFNVITGRLDAAKRDAVWDHWKREIGERFDADAIVDSQISAHSVEFGTNHEVTFCGRTMSVHSPEESRLGRAFEAWMLGGTTGVTSVSCLLIRLTDLSEVVMYESVGGIEPLATIAKSKISSVPLDSRLKNPDNNGRAVQLALDRLILGPPKNSTNDRR